MFTGSICCIKVLSSGCKACHQLYDNTVKAVEGMGIEVEYVTDLQKIMEYGAMSMPALVVNEKLVSSGKTLKSAKILKIIEKTADESTVFFWYSVAFLFMFNFIAVPEISLFLFSVNCSEL